MSGKSIFINNSVYKMYVKDYGETYWIFPFSFAPYLNPLKSYKELNISSQKNLEVSTVVLNSSLYYFFYTSISDCWHFGKWHIEVFKFPNSEVSEIRRNKFIDLHNKLVASMKSNRIIRFDKRVDGNLYEYKISFSKPILDEIDTVLAEHYSFTPEELDFIINYDIKYRMGRGSGEEE